MKKLITLSLSMLSLTVLPWWTQSEITKRYCKDAVKSNGKYKLLRYPLSAFNKSSILLSHRKENAELIKLDRMNGDLIWTKKLSIKPVAIAIHKQFIFVLTANELYQHSSIDGKIIQKIAFDNNYGNKYIEAQDLAVKDETIYISLGSRGVNTYFFDDKEIIFMENFYANVNPDNAHRSYVTGLSLSPNNNDLLLAIDNITLGYDKKAFEGFLILDSEYLNIKETLPLKNNLEVLARPLIHWNTENNFLVNNMNVLMGFSTKKKPRRSTVSPNKRFLKYANGGRPLGHVLVIDKDIRYCELIGEAHQKHAIPAFMTYEP